MEMPWRLQSAPVLSVDLVKTPSRVRRDHDQGAILFENSLALINQPTRVGDVLYDMVHRNRVEEFSPEILFLHATVIDGQSLFARGFYGAAVEVDPDHLPTPALHRL